MTEVEKIEILKIAVEIHRLPHWYELTTTETVIDTYHKISDAVTQPGPASKP